ncbi:MAG: hypothetical protein EOO54_08860 [Haliea sp.]|nr:MAG: hypothetical protein EOO54_08860 [Haliea sp.]
MDRTATDRQAALARLALCFALPLALTWGFYAAEQRTVHHATRMDPLGSPAPVAGVQYLVDENRALDRKYVRVAGWIFDPANDIDWLRPSVLVVAPDGNAVEFRANIRRREDLPRPSATEKQKNIAGFEVRMKARRLPRGGPLKLYLVIHRGGKREVIDTGSVLAGARA